MSGHLEKAKEVSNETIRQVITDEEFDRFTELFRKYRDEGKLPADERLEFQKLSALVKKGRRT